MIPVTVILAQSLFGTQKMTRIDCGAVKPAQGVDATTFADNRCIQGLATLVQGFRPRTQHPCCDEVVESFSNRSSLWTANPQT